VHTGEQERRVVFTFGWWTIRRAVSLGKVHAAAESVCTVSAGLAIAAAHAAAIALYCMYYNFGRVVRPFA